MISLDMKPDQIAEEVRAITRVTAASKGPMLQPISPEAVIRPLPPGRFRPPAFLTRTAPPGLAAELTDLFQELRSVHEEHVGEKVLDVVAYVNVTGSKLDLEERLRSWAERYFRLRAAPHHLNPAVQSDPFLLFEKLVRECEQIFGGLGRADNALTPAFLQLTLDYVPWLLFTLLWRDLLVWTEDGWTVGYTPAHRGVPLAIGHWLRTSGWLDDRLNPFLRRLADVADPGLLASIGRADDEVLRQRLAMLAADCQAMRPMLLRNFRPHKTAVRLGADLFVAWHRVAHQGIASLVTGRTVESIQENAHRLASPDPIAVGHDGLLLDWRRPWLTSADAPLTEGIRPLVLNYHLLDRLHDKLFDFYDRIDFRKLVRERSRVESLAEDDAQEIVAAGCLELAEPESEPRDGIATDGMDTRRRVRSLRSERLLRVLADVLGCEVRPGPGSEVVVHRPGGKIFTLGHHKQNAEVHPVLVHLMLRRLGITVNEWLAAVAR